MGGPTPGCPQSVSFSTAIPKLLNLTHGMENLKFRRVGMKYRITKYYGKYYVVEIRKFFLWYTVSRATLTAYYAATWNNIEDVPYFTHESLTDAYGTLYKYEKSLKKEVVMQGEI